MGGRDGREGTIVICKDGSFLNERVFDKDSIPSDEAGWGIWRKHALTKALRINGSFQVETTEGTISCQDGYLCVDSRGYPYPVAKDEFEKIYVQVKAIPIRRTEDV